MQTTIDRYPSLKKQALRDLSLRARGGVFIYLAIWLITAVWAEIIQSNPGFFYFNSILLIALSAMRIIHHLVLKKNPDLNTTFMYRSLISLILFIALHWGILSAWIIFNSPYQGLHYPYMVLLAAFAIGGTIILSISRLISVLYPFFIFVPSLIMGFVVGGTENLIMILLAIFSIIYVLDASRVSHNDYKKAIYNHMVADEKAKLLEKLSITDPLTGLKNRMHFTDQFSDKWVYCNKHQLPLSILMIDLDRFKRINDTYGHISGDEYLKLVAKVLKSEVHRSTDTVARYGGEEFVIILPDTDLAYSTEIAKRLVEAISKINLLLDGKPVSVSCSIGVACTIPDSIENAEMLLILADNALYQAKEQGRNRFCVSNELIHISSTSS